jgi:hypothetical protein
MVAAGGLLGDGCAAHHLVIVLHREIVWRSLNEVGKVLPVVGGIIINNCATWYTNRNGTIY